MTADGRSIEDSVTNMRPRLRAGWAFGLAMLSVVSTAFADANQNRVRQLDTQAMQAYAELEIDRANQLLEQARQLAERSGIHGNDLARIHLHLGIVAIGGSQDRAAGLEAFRRALAEDPSIELERENRTPEIVTVFENARSSAPAATPPPRGGSAVPTSGPLLHTPPEQQLVRTPVPVFVEIPEGERVSRMVIRYRGAAMRQFREMAMSPLVEGFGAELPCEDVVAPSIAYYALAFAPNGNVVGRLGSEDRPVEVPIVTRRSRPAPALPGRAPPESCAAVACAPGTPGCGDAVAEEPEAPPPAAAPAGESAPRFYVQAGIGVGAGYAADGMTAASLPSVSPPPVDPQTNLPTVDDSFYASGKNGCGAPAGEYCVRVTTNGFLPIYAPRLYIGYWVSEKVGISVGMRYQIAAGPGTLSHFLLQFRLHYQFVAPPPSGFHANMYLAMSTGQVQLRPSQEPTNPGESIDRPWIKTGLGGTELGAVVGYRLNRHLGLYVNPELYVLYRDFSMGAELIFGADVAF